ncbi:MAG: FG-GAP repeat protein [Kiritimatiellae bacterium]|nr:FG-GAP repeat protein [Kiritimatiellia bacterium]
MKRILNCLLKSMLVLGVTALAEQDLTTNDGTGTGALIRQARYLVNLALPGGDSVYLQPGESGLYDYSRARGNQSRWYVMNDGATAGAIAVTYADPGYGSGTYSPPPDYFGYKFKYPVTITQLTYVDYCFGDGGTFSSAPELQVLSSLAGTWTTVTSSITPAYQNWFSSGRRVTYTITPEHLITDAWGVRLYGNTTASRAWDQNGWVGVTELRVSGTPAFGLALDFTVNIALSGTPFCSNNAWKAGDGKEINDGNFDNHTELWDAAAPAGDKQVGISWSAPQRDVAALGVAMTFFIDGGWYHDTPADPLQVEYTSDGVNWSAVTGLKKGRYTADYAVCAALPWEYKGTWLFTFDPVDNVRGIRLSGLPAGDVAALGGHGYISLREMEVYAAFPVPPECLAGSYLKPTNTTAGSRLGFSVAVNGDTAIVGAPLEDGVAADSGAAYIFVKTNGVWSQQAYLKAGTIGWGHLFGYSVDISGETAIVGVPMENGNAYQSGAAYVFVREDGVWSQQAYLKASNKDYQDQFGNCVAISGDSVIIGALFEDGGGGNAGAAYVFTRSAGVWSQQAHLKASNAGFGDCFGVSVDIDGDVAVVGACYEDDLANDSGAAYVFTRSAGIWSQQAFLKATNAGASDYFGIGVAIDGDSVIVGASGEDSNATDVDGDPANNSAVNSGAAYIFARTGDLWSQQAYLKATNTGADDSFGYAAVDICGDIAVVGAYGEDGSAIGVYGADDNYASGAGAAYAYIRNNGVWSSLAYLKAKNTGVDDRIGVSVATDGKTIIAGADFEDGGATEVDGLDNDALDNAGAAYTFDLLEWEPGLSILSAVVTSGGRWGDFNFAQGKTVTPHSNVKSGNPQYVVDANYGTSWYSYQGNGNQISFTLDLGCEITIGCFVHYPLQTEFYQIESSSDGSNWSSRVSAAIPAVPAAAFTNDVSGAYSARYIRYTGKTTQVAWVGVAEFEVYGVASAAENMILSFRSLPQRLYTLQQCNDLQVGIWTDVPGQTRVPGTGGRLALQHQRTAPAQFYRLKESETQ